MGEVFGKIHSVETCGTVDGPGVRYVVFTQGCPLRCVYCHNPDTRAATCKSMTSMTASELVSDILKYKSYFKFSGGGVTLTGGEPLMQKSFVAALFKECQNEFIHTTLDTSGYDDIDQTTKELLKHTDLVLLDIKSISDETFKKVTGFSNDKTIRFANYLSEHYIDTWVSFVLVPGLTDIEEELHGLASFLTTKKNVKRVRILPFHQLGAYKWQDLSLNYQLKETRTPSLEETERVRDLFRGYGFEVT
jgi:pyruvate formate lyase activating enzyme